MTAYKYHETILRTKVLSSSMSPVFVFVFIFLTTDQVTAFLLGRELKLGLFSVIKAWLFGTEPVITLT